MKVNIENLKIKDVTHSFVEEALGKNIDKYRKRKPQKYITSVLIAEIIINNQNFLDIESIKRIVYKKIKAANAIKLLGSRKIVL